MRNVDTSISKWEDEVCLNLLPPFKDGLEYRSYELSKTAQRKDGGLELEIILNRKPSTNKFYIPIETRNLDFFYQPPLTAEEIKGGAYRPENVIGSYAVYHKTKSGNYLGVGGKNYMAGKAFHVYRPKAIDNRSRESWCSLRIYPSQKMMVVTVPQEYLDNASYPVIIDPDFGFTSPGASYNSHSPNYIAGAKFACPGAGTATSMSAYIAQTAASYAQLGIYDDAATTRNRVGYTGAVAIPVGYDWVHPAITVGGTLSAADYWLVINNDVDCTWAYDAGATAQYIATTYNTWPATITASWSAWGDYKYTIYVTYGSAGGTNIVRMII